MTTPNEPAPTNQPVVPPEPTSQPLQARGPAWIPKERGEDLAHQIERTDREIAAIASEVDWLGQQLKKETARAHAEKEAQEYVDFIRRATHARHANAYRRAAGRPRGVRPRAPRTMTVITATEAS